MVRVDGESDFDTFKRAFWGKFSDSNGDVTTPQFWLDVSNGTAWEGPGAEVQCWDCKERDKNYNLYVSHREWECLYIAYDLNRRRIIGRCVLCELIVRCKGDLP